MSKNQAKKNSAGSAASKKAPVKATANKANEEKKDETVKDAVAENEKEQDATGTVETQRPANKEGISEASADKANVGDSPDEAVPEENSDLKKANELDDFEPKDAEDLEPEEEGWKDGQYVGDKTKNEEINNLEVEEEKPASNLSHEIGEKAMSGKPLDGIKIEFILSGTPKLINDAFVYEINQQDIDNNEALASNEVGSTITITRLKPEEKGKPYDTASGESEASDSAAKDSAVYENVDDVNSEEIKKQDMIERRKARRDERQK